MDSCLRRNDGGEYPISNKEYRMMKGRFFISFSVRSPKDSMRMGGRNVELRMENGELRVFKCGFRAFAGMTEGRGYAIYYFLFGIC
jgi:hypothetical protein